ncbi:MAG: hypothetical protein AAGG75_28070, partial [Bacteroidota bacterium]
QDIPMRQTMSELLQCMGTFLAYRRFDQSEDLGPELQLAAAYREKNLEKHFNQAIKLASKQLDKKVQDPEYFYAKYRLEMEQYNFIESLKRTTSNNLQVVSHALDTYLLSSKLRQSCLLLAHQAVYKTEYDYSFLPVLISYLEDSPHLDTPAIALYYYCYRALTEKEEHYFQKFLQALRQHADFSPEGIQDLILLAVNYRIRQINQGDRSYIEEALALYKMGLEREVFTQQGYLSRFTYKNIVALGLGIRQFQWIEQFLHQYREALAPRYRESFFNFNLAKLYFTQLDFDRAMPLLAKVDDSDLLLQLDAKVLLLKMYYESQEFEALESLLVSFRAFLQRKKILGYHKIHYSGIIRFTRKILEVNSLDKQAIAKLRAHIQAEEMLPEQEWLLEKLQEL